MCVFKSERILLGGARARGPGRQPQGRTAASVVVARDVTLANPSLPLSLCVSPSFLPSLCLSFLLTLPPSPSLWLLLSLCLSFLPSIPTCVCPHPLCVSYNLSLPSLHSYLFSPPPSLALPHQPFLSLP